MNKEKNLQDYLQKIKFKDNIVFDKEDIKASFTKIMERIDIPSEVVLNPVRNVSLFSTLPFRIAASIAIIFTISLFGYNYYDSQKQILVENSTNKVMDVVLPDGSNVALRTNSSLAYRNNYSKNRKVELHGEALFEVTKDKVHPFTVSTKFGNVTVLGTVFSVRSFENESYTKSLLKEGSVKFEDTDQSLSVVLKPGEEAKLIEGQKEIKVRKVTNIDRELAWKSHNFSFENEPMGTILAVICDAYDKKVSIKNSSLANEKYSLKFIRGESLTKMLDVLSEVAKFNYQVENNNVIVKK